MQCIAAERHSLPQTDDALSVAPAVDAEPERAADHEPRIDLDVVQLVVQAMLEADVEPFGEKPAPRSTPSTPGSPGGPPSRTPITGPIK